MSESDRTDPFARIRRGLLELAVLTALAPGRLYAAEILERLSGTPFATQEGTLYPLLGKLRRDGLLEHEWEESDSGPPRKYHHLTDAGTARRSELADYWRELDTSLHELGAPR
jgi:PadR family transcriptional regulator PadR